MQYLNLSFYRFADLQDLIPLRAELKAECARREMRGTILLSHEGINAFIAGKKEDLESFTKYLEARTGINDFPYKESYTDYLPYKRMLVKIKKEIISMGVPEIRPHEFTGKRIRPKELQKWMNEKRDFVLLDTRNDYEVRVGTFQGAIELGIKHFRHFPKALDTLPPELKEKPVVTFCTGGIRCEKASALLVNRGFKDVYQIDGGILRYFEEVGADHYEGDCFVFDQRVAVDPKLTETEIVQCYACRSPVTPQEQKNPLYVPNQSCPHCAKAIQSA